VQRSCDTVLKFFITIVQHITAIIQEYQERLNQIPYVPRTSFRRASVGHSCDANKNFLTFLFRDQTTGMQFLKDVGLIRSKMQCNSCGNDMTWYVEPNIPDGFSWRCQRVAGKKCSGSRSVRHRSCFQQSPHAPGGSVPYVRHPATRTCRHNTITSMIIDWKLRYILQKQCWYTWKAALRRSAVLTRPLRSTRPISVGENTIGQPVKDQCVFGGVERESGRTFLVTVPDRTADTLTNVKRVSIESGTTLTSDCWAAYWEIESQGYTHRNVSHSNSFVNSDRRDNTNTIECTWHHVNAFLVSYHRQEYEYHLAYYMLAAKCNAHKCLCSLNALPLPHLSTGLPVLHTPTPNSAPRDFQLFISVKIHTALQVSGRSHSWQRNFRHVSSSA
jgi:hypothetical protein